VEVGRPEHPKRCFKAPFSPRTPRVRPAPRKPHLPVGNPWRFCYSPANGVSPVDPRRAGRGGPRFESRRAAISNKVFVGNLSFDATREEILEVFSTAGRVVDVKVPTDRETGRPRGFAFVEFESDEAAQQGIQKLNGQSLRGRPLRVNEAENRPPRPAGSAPPERSAYRPPPSSFGAPFHGAMPPPPFPPPLDGAPFGKEPPRKKFRENKEAERPRRQEKRRRQDTIDDDYDT
jgi:RNA recognition motif-containing protein